MPSRILIADDNPPNRELLEAYLAEIDCIVETAVDGQDTLAKVKSFKPDLNAWIIVGSERIKLMMPPIATAPAAM